MPDRNPITAKYTSPQGAATYTGLSVFTIRELIAKGELPAYRLSDKPGSAIRVKISDVDALMKPVVPEAVTVSRAGR